MNNINFKKKGIKSIEEEEEKEGEEEKQNCIFQ